MPKPSLLQSLKDRRLFQWAAAYLCGAWVLVEATNLVVEQFFWPLVVGQAVTIVSFFGFFVVMVIAWYHGERGRQWVSGAELLIISLLLLISGGVLFMLGGSPEDPDSSLADPMQPADVGSLSVAVLPCQNMSPDPSDEYLAAGLHDEILLRLQKISSLTSIGRTSVMRYAQDPPPTSEIAADLGVAFVGECSVRKAADQIRLTFQLLDGSTGEQLWADHYDREMTVENLFEMQSDIAQQVARAIGAVLTPDERARIEIVPTDNLEAYSAYLMGRLWWNRRTVEEMWNAIQCFETAIASDSAFALAFAGMADSYALLGYYGGLSPREGFTRAKHAARRALQLDHTLAEAHTSLAGAMLFYDWDWLGAEGEFRQAIELNPGYATAHHWYAVLLWVHQRLNESRAEIQRAHQLDPMSSIISRDIGKQLYFERRYEEAIVEFRKTIDLDPEFYLAHWYLGRALLLTDQVEEAIRAFDEAVDLSDNDPFQIAALAHAHATAGNRAEAIKLLGVLEETDNQGYVSPYGLAEIHTALGDLDSAFQLLERAYEDRSVYLIYLPVEPRLDPLRSDPRFLDLLNRMGLQ